MILIWTGRNRQLQGLPPLSEERADVGSGAVLTAQKGKRLEGYFFQ